MRQEQSRRKTPAARILSLALALCMIAAFVPAFTLTVGAATYTSDYLVENADYTFTYGDITTTWNNIYFGGTEAEKTNWAGWTSDSTNLRLYKISQTFIAVDSCDTGTAMILTASDEVQESTAGKDYIVVEWTGNDAQSYNNAYNWFDVAYADENGVFDTFRYFKKSYTSDLGPGIHWDWGDGWAGNTYSNCFADLANDWTYEGNSSYGTIGSSIDYTLYRMVYANDEDGDGYTVSYYYNDNGTSGSYQLIGTKTFAEGTVSNFTSMQIGGYVPSDVRIDYFKIYAGNYPAATNTVTVTYKVDGTEVDSASGTYDTSSADYYTFAEKYLYYNGEVYYAEEQQLSADKDVEMTLVAHYLSSDLKDASTFEYGGKQYIPANEAETFESVVVNGDFITGDASGWTTRNGGDSTSSVGTETIDSESVNYLQLGNVGAGGTTNLGQVWALDADTTYYMSFMMDDVALSSGKLYASLKLSDTADNARATCTADISSGALTSGTNLVDFAVSSEWTTYETVFTTTEDTSYLALAFSWMSAKLANVQIVPIVENTDASATVTVNYQVDGTTVTTATKTVVKGNTASFDAISNYAYNGKYYSCDALEYTSVSGDAEYDIALTVDSSKYAPTSDFSYNFTSGEVLYASDTKDNIDFSAEGNEATISIGWNNLRQTIMTFDVSDLMTEGTILSSIVLNMNIGYKNVADYVIAAIDPAMVDTETPSMNTSGTYSSYSAISTLLTDLSAVTVASGTGSTGWNAITLDLSNANDLIDGDGTLALFIYTDNTTYGQFYTYTVNTDYPPYLSDPATTTAVSYTVKYVDEDGISLQDDTTYNTTADNTLGYDDEVIVPYVTIPYFMGYIFTSKDVDTGSNTVTLTYTATTTVDAASVGGSNFFSNVDDDTQFVSLNMLGAHDAFTSGIDSNNLKYDAGGIAQGDDGSTNASLILAGSSTVANYSKAQDLTALELLEAGVRYFDVRLSRSTVDQDAGLLYNNAPHTNGVFYTTHGVLSDEFRPIAYTIGQWLAEHPGEVISLYFQEAWDDGDATSTTYADIAAILEEAGINDYAPYYYNNGTSLKNVTYGNLTDSGEHAGVVMFARAVGYTQGNFYYGSTSATYSWAGKLYSYYDSSAIPDEFTASYIQTQVDTLADYNTTDDPSGDHPVYHMARVMQAQSESSNLLSAASSDNSALYTALTSVSTDDYNYSEWLTALPMVMVNGVGRNTEDLAKLLQNCNEAHDITITYVDESGTTLATKTKSVLVGSLYTDEAEYTIVDNSYDATDGSSVVYSLETLTTKPSTSYGSAVVFTPAYGLTSNSTTISDTIEIVAAKLTDTVYTVRDGILYSSASGVGSDSSNPAFSAYTWGSSLTSPDRIGIAIVTVPDDEVDATKQYELTATQLRSYSTGSLKTYFYIIPINTYNSIDVSDSSALAELFDDSYIATYSKTYDNNDTTSAEVSYTLDTDDISAYAGQTVVIIGTSTVGLYGLSSDIAIEVTDKDYGVDLYAGAQIRVGSGMDSDTQELLGDSGLRFIAVVDKTETMAANASEIGIAIFDGGFSTTAVTASSAKEAFEGTTPVTKITDENYQSDTVFTAAIINIAESNYNRIYVAVPYVVVNGTTYYNWDATVARTPYQVAKGILVDSDATSGYTQLDGDGNEVAGTDALINVLNVYTNKTGARITVASSEGGYTIVAADYANGATEFFTVSENSTLLTSTDGTGTIILVPMNDSVKFYDYAEDYYRVNNAHDAFIDAKGATAEIDENGYLVITIPAATE